VLDKALRCDPRRHLGCVMDARLEDIVTRLIPAQTAGIDPLRSFLAEGWMGFETPT